MIPHSKKGEKLYFDKEVITKQVLENKISRQENIQYSLKVFNIF